MKIFQENSSTLMDQFSQDFEKSYLQTLKQRHSTVSVNANNVYQEVIRERHHIHMNSTCWATLTDFVQYLGKTGKCVVEETERGWFVQYIDRDPALMKKREMAQRRVESEREQELLFKQRLEQARRDAALHDGGSATILQPTEIDKTALGTTKIAVPTIAAAGSTLPRPLINTNVFGDSSDDEDEPDSTDKPQQTQPQQDAPTKKRSPTTNQPHIGSNTVKRAKHENDQDSKKHDHNNKIPKYSQTPIPLIDKRKKYWLHLDILVRVINKSLADGSYYKRKGVVTKLIDKYTAHIKMADGGDTLQMDQDDLETVVPTGHGEKVLIVNGRGRGHVATIEHVDSKKYRADLILQETGQLLEKVDYEDFSKLA